MSDEPEGQRASLASLPARLSLYARPEEDPSIHPAVKSRCRKFCFLFTPRGKGKPRGEIAVTTGFLENDGETFPKRSGRRVSSSSSSSSVSRKYKKVRAIKCEYGEQVSRNKLSEMSGTILKSLHSLRVLCRVYFYVLAQTRHGFTPTKGKSFR